VAALCASSGGILRLRYAPAQDDEQRRARYFFTISAFSIMAIPPRSAILPFNVTVLPQYSAN
jgi:hypothetical protein